MKIFKIYPIAALILALTGSCNINSDRHFNLSESSKVILVNESVALGLLLPVNLGIAGHFVILSKTGITDVFNSIITGNVGTSPITGDALLLTCAEVAGKIYIVDICDKHSCRVSNAVVLSTAVGDMKKAYSDAAGRSNPDFLNIGGGDIGGMLLTSGLYKWTSSVIIPTNVTISGGANEIFIFQIEGNLNTSTAAKICLVGGVQPKNIFWQISGVVTLETSSHLEGTILSQSAINLKTGASINGRALAQTAVTLQRNTITKPL